MALDTSSVPCDLLSTANYPDLWISNTLSVTQINLRKIASLSTSDTPTPSLVQFAAPSDKSKIILSSTSSKRLISFMNGKTFDQCSLKSGSTFKTILGDYAGGSTYINSDGTGAALNINSVYTALVGAGFLLTKDEVFKSSDFNTTPSAGSESLMYLYNLKQQGTTLTQVQTTRMISLENKNLLFFAAFLMEYCYYRSRYQYMLALFFNVYSGETNASTLTSLGISTAWIVKVMAMLNTKLVDMRRLLNEINQQYTTITTSIRNDINTPGVLGSNQDLNDSVVALKASAEEAKKYTSEAEFKKAAMEYAAEKNRYANIQLGLYAILNIAALAMIFKLK